MEEKDQLLEDYASIGTRIETLQQKEPTHEENSQEYKKYLYMKSKVAEMPKSDPVQEMVETAPNIFEPEKTTFKVVTEDKLVDGKGKPVTPDKLEFFYTWVENHFVLKKACEIKNVPYYTALSWTRKPWWKELHEDYVQFASQSFVGKMASFHEKTIEAWEDIVMGVDTTDKTANARVQAIRLYMEAGKNPIIEKKSSVNIDARTQNANITLDINKVKELTREQLLYAAKTGEVPDTVVSQKNS